VPIRRPEGKKGQIISNQARRIRVLTNRKIIEEKKRQKKRASQFPTKKNKKAGENGTTGIDSRIREKDLGGGEGEGVSEKCSSSNLFIVQNLWKDGEKGPRNFGEGTTTSQFTREGQDMEKRPLTLPDFAFYFDAVYIQERGREWDHGRAV